MMVNDEELDTQQQISIIKKWALSALAGYPIKVVRVSFLWKSMNTTFRVFGYEEQDRDAQELKQFVLRIHPPDWLDKNAIHSELVLLQMLREKAGLSVPQPVLTREGSLVLETSSMELPVQRCCVLFRFMSGRFNKIKLGAHSIQKAGAFLAKVHQFGEEFVLPADFTRPRLDWEGLFGEKGMFPPANRAANLSVDELLTVERASTKIETAMRSLDKTKGNFGLIHGDLYYSNFFFKNGEIQVIDFDMCGFGYYLFDLAVPYWPVKQGDTQEAMKEFLRGYRRLRPLMREEEEYLNIFLAARRLIDVNWLLARIRHFPMELVRGYIGEMKLLIRQG